MQANHRYKHGDRITWLRTRKWGGKQNEPAIFLYYSGEQSAIINVDGQKRTVRLKSIRAGQGSVKLHDMEPADMYGYRYGADSDDPDSGILLDPSRCIEEVFVPTVSRWRQCRRRPGHGPKELYCSAHSINCDDADQPHDIQLSIDLLSSPADSYDDILYWYVFDHERLMWWKANYFGYTNKLEEAGLYGRENIAEIARVGNNYGITTSFVPAIDYLFEQVDKG